MGEAGFPSLVIMSLELICFVSSFAKFSLLIVVYNMGFQSLRTDLCLLYSIMCCSYFFFSHCNESGRLFRHASHTSSTSKEPSGK